MNPFNSFLLLIVLTIGCLQSQTTKAQSELIPESLTWQDRERSYLLQLPPPALRNGPLPVLFLLHGGGGSANGFTKFTKGCFNEFASQEGFIVVYPNAVSNNWNDGRKEKIKPTNVGVDDVGFIVSIVERLQHTYNIDNNKIFTAGISNGGFMSTRLLCDRADLFRGGAILTATIYNDHFEICNPSNPVGILVMNGTEDPFVPYNGGELTVLGVSAGQILSTSDFVNFWKEKNKCNNELPKQILNNKKFDGTTVEIREFTDCEESGVIKVYDIIGGGHAWPGGNQYLPKKIVGITSREINACDEIWAFFKSLA